MVAHVFSGNLFGTSMRKLRNCQLDQWVLDGRLAVLAENTDNVLHSFERLEDDAEVIFDKLKELNERGMCRFHLPLEPQKCHAQNVGTGVRLFIEDKIFANWLWNNVAESVYGYLVLQHICE